MIIVLMAFLLLCLIYFFFFKQKTAYEMRISDWSSDVCSSDLSALGRWDRLFQHHHRVPGGYREMRDSCLWRGVVYLQRLFGHDQHRRRTIGDLDRKSVV